MKTVVDLAFCDTYVDLALYETYVEQHYMKPMKN